jgi:uncharacterized repeat protein (TIGR04002 family)
MSKTKSLVVSALFTALIFVFTAYVFHIPIGSGGGYIHFGDAFIYIAAVVLPFPNALFAGAIGGGLADFMSGASVWMPFTVIIKPLMALCFTNKGDTILKSKRNLIAPIFAGIICIAGYFVAERIIYGNYASAVASAGVGMVQFFGSAALYYIFAGVIDNRNLKGMIR